MKRSLIISHGVSGCIPCLIWRYELLWGNGSEAPCVLNVQHWPEIGYNVAQIALPITTEVRLTSELVCVQLQTEQPVPVPWIESTSRNGSEQLSMCSANCWVVSATVSSASAVSTPENDVDPDSDFVGGRNSGRSLWPVNDVLRLKI